MKNSHLDNKNKQIEKKFISNNQGYIGDEYHHNKRYQNNNKFDSCDKARERVIADALIDCLLICSWY